MIMSTKEICKRGLSMAISLTLGNSGFPLADGLTGHVQLLGHLFLGQTGFAAQVDELFTQGHRECLL